MKVRDLLLIGATSVSLAVAPALVLADEAPLAAGGPAAQAEGVLGLGSMVEIGGVIFVVTVAGLVLANNDDSASTTTTN
jgi:hypothetical protein